MSRGPRFAGSWRLARRELRGGLRGFGVFLACLFLGVFAIAAVGSFAAAARAGLLADARALLGGDLEVRLVHRPPTPEQERFLAARGELSTVLEMRAMVRAGEGERAALTELKAVDPAYPLYGEVQLEPPQPLAAALAPDAADRPGAVAEAALLERLGIGVGDELRLGEAVLRVTGVLAREPDRTLRAFTLGPRLLLSRAGLAASGLLQPGSLVTHAVRLRLPAQGDPDAVKAALTATFPEAGWRVQTWREAAPRVRRVLDRLTVNLTLVGLCALLVGGVGVAGAVRGYLAGKVFNIATMKCLGAERRTIFGGYLLQILLLGAAGSAAGLVAGGALPALLASLAGERLPVPLAPGLYPAPLAVAALFGLLVALAFSLRELGSACRVPPAVLFRGYAPGDRAGAGPGVRVAVAAAACALAGLAIATSSDRLLAAWFIAGALGCFGLFRGLALLVVAAARRLPRPRHPGLRLALGNIHRPGSPAGSILFSLGVGLTALVIIALVQANLTRLVGETLPEQAPAFFFLDIQPGQAEAFADLLASLPGVEGMERYPTLRGRITAIDGVPVDQARIDPEVSWAVRGDRFLSYAAEEPADTVLSAGRWWPADYAGPPLLSLTADLARGFGVGVGDPLTVNVLGRTVTATIASLREVDWSTLDLDFALIFSPGVLEGAPQTSIAAVHVPPEGETAVFRAVTGRFPNVSVIGVREVLGGVVRTLERLAAAFRGMAAVAVVSGFLVLAGAVSADQHRRIRDAVIFKVCGATRRDLLTALAAEFLLLGTAAGLLSAGAGALAAWGIVAGPLEARYVPEPGTILATVAAGVALTVALGLLGTWKALGHKPADYLRGE